MDIESKILEDLKKLDLSTSIYFYDKPESANNIDNYIRYFILNEVDILHCGNESLATRYDIQVDYFTNGNYNAICNKIKRELKLLGYIYLESDFEVYKMPNGTKSYCKTLRFRLDIFNNNNNN